MAKRKEKPLSVRALREQTQRASLELDLAQTEYAASLMKSSARLFAESDASNLVVDDERGWQMIASGSQLVQGKDINGPGLPRINLLLLRKQSYRLWRLNPHARGIIRNFCKYIIGREFKLDFADTQMGHWDDTIKKEKLVKTMNEPDLDANSVQTKDDLLVRLVWEDFVKHNNFTQRAKEIVTRAFRDGEVFVRRFVFQGRLSVRFIEPDAVQNPPGQQTGEVLITDDLGLYIGQSTRIMEGVEFVDGDVETVVAYHVRTSPSRVERIPAKDVIHRKCIADSNDLRGIPLLECVMKKLTNYEQWEEYRIILNKVRTAVALVRKIESGTATQAAALLAGRQPARANPQDRTPQTTSGNREAAFRPGTVLTPGPGVGYEFIAPNLQARDAAEDGRRILLTVAAGMGIPEQLLTSDWSNAAYASSQQAMEAVQREWEDWQDFFQPVFEQIYEWVIDAAVEFKGLPQETDRGVDPQWPTIVKADAEKETKRRATLQSAGVLSRRTWAAQEGLVFDDERENMNQDAESEMEADALAQAALSAQGALDDDEKRPDAAPPKRARDDDDNDIEEQVRHAHDTLLALADLEEAGTKSKHMNDGERRALGRYVEATRTLVLSRHPGQRSRLKESITRRRPRRK